MKFLSSLIMLCLALLSNTVFVQAQQLTEKEKPLFTPPRMCHAVLVKAPLAIDGKLDEAAWQQVAWSEAFTDIEGDLQPKHLLKTRMKMLWDDSCLYIAAKLEEPHVWATLSKHDAVIFHDNDFEVFIDPFNTTQPYFEIEVNAVNAIFDLLLPKPYRNGGSAMIGWDVQGLRSAVSIQGTINNTTDIDSSWTVEMAIPFSALTLGNDVHIPKINEQWRINFSRVEWDTDMANGKYVKRKTKEGKPLPEHNWVWSPQGVVNMHYPERWGYVQFVKDSSTALQRPLDEVQRNLLWLAYYRQKTYQQKNGNYASSLPLLNLNDNCLQLEATNKQFIISLKEDLQEMSINQDGLILCRNTPVGVF